MPSGDSVAVRSKVAADEASISAGPRRATAQSVVNALGLRVHFHRTMPEATPPADTEDVLLRVVREVGCYSLDAYLFVEQGIAYTVNRVHGKRKRPDQNMHVTGQQLCEGLRDLAIERWGLLAGTVLRRWGVTRTMDFGQIVFALVQKQLLSKTEDDRLDDFRDVFDFRAAFDGAYVIPPKAAPSP
jgi:uncharacterized repeat protein (TIGR04138 family)